MITWGQAARTTTSGDVARPMAEIVDTHRMHPVREAALLNAQARADQAQSALADQANAGTLTLQPDEHRLLVVSEHLLSLAARNERADQNTRGLFVARAGEAIQTVAAGHMDDPRVAETSRSLSAAAEVLERFGPDSKHQPLTARQPAIRAMDDRGAPQVSLEAGRVVLAAVAEGQAHAHGTRKHPTTQRLYQTIAQSRNLPADQAATHVVSALDRVLASDRDPGGSFLGIALDKGSVEFTRDWIAGRAAGPRRAEHEQPTEPAPPARRSASRGEEPER